MLKHLHFQMCILFADVQIMILEMMNYWQLPVSRLYTWKITESIITPGCHCWNCRSFVELRYYIQYLCVKSLFVVALLFKFLNHKTIFSLQFISITKQVDDFPLSTSVFMHPISVIQMTLWLQVKNNQQGGKSLNVSFLSEK